MGAAERNGGGAGPGEDPPVGAAPAAPPDTELLPNSLYVPDVEEAAPGAADEHLSSPSEEASGYWDSEGEATELQEVPAPESDAFYQQLDLAVQRLGGRPAPRPPPRPVSQTGLRLRGFGHLDTLRSVFASLGAPLRARQWLSSRHEAERGGMGYDIEALYLYLERNEEHLRGLHERADPEFSQAMLLELRFFSIGLPLMGGRVPSEAPPALAGRIVRRRTGP